MQSYLITYGGGGDVDKSTQVILFTVSDRSLDHLLSKYCTGNQNAKKKMLFSFIRSPEGKMPSRRKEKDGSKVSIYLVTTYPKRTRGTFWPKIISLRWIWRMHRVTYLCILCHPIFEPHNWTAPPSIPALGKLTAAPLKWICPLQSSTCPDGITDITSRRNGPSWCTSIVTHQLGRMISQIEHHYIMEPCTTEIFWVVTQSSSSGTEVQTKSCTFIFRRQFLRKCPWVAQNPTICFIRWNLPDLQYYRYRHLGSCGASIVVSRNTSIRHY